MENREDVCILIPALNEAKTIGEIVSEFKSLGYRNILVMDGHSTDGTPEKAREAGARVLTQSGSGKGQAIKEAFQLIEDEYVVLIDGDGTYLPNEVDRLLEPLLEGRADHVIGNRFANYQIGAFTRLNLLGNKVLNKLFGFAYGGWLNDILSGYRAFTREAVKSLEISQTGFEIESEITAESIKKDLRIVEVPITYLARSRGAKTKLHPLRDGFRIGATIYLLAKIHNPLFYFSIIGGVLTLLGLAIGAYVVDEWLKGINHIPMTILATLLIISGIQMFIFALLSDLIVSLHRENIRLIQKSRPKE